MNKPLKYAKLVLEAWPHLHEIITTLRNRPLAHDAAISAGISALALIMDELDEVEGGKKLAEDAKSRIDAIMDQATADDRKVDQMLAEKFDGDTK